MAPRFGVSPEALAEACATLGLRGEVEVRITYYDYLEGRYIADDNGVHRIGLDGDLSARKASEVLWHELAHVRQAERLGGLKAFDREWGRQMKAEGVTATGLRSWWSSAYRYNRAPLEQEANDIARRHRRRRLTLRRLRHGMGRRG